MALVTERQDFFNRHRAMLFSDFLPYCLDGVDGVTDFLLPALSLRDQPGDTPAVAGDYDGGATLDLIEQLRQMGLGLRSLHFAQPLTRIIGPKGGGLFAEALAVTFHSRLSS